MKGSIGLGLLIGILSAIFLPYVFLLIASPGAFNLLNDVFTDLGSNPLNGLARLLSAPFGVTPQDPVNFYAVNSNTYVTAGISGYFTPNLLGAFLIENYDYMYLIVGILVWVVCGLLSAIFTQSIKKGMLSAIIFVTVEILIALLMAIVIGKDLAVDLLQVNNLVGGLLTNFLGAMIITPVAFGIVGGLVGGAISQFAFGPEEI